MYSTAWLKICEAAAAPLERRIGKILARMHCFPFILMWKFYNNLLAKLRPLPAKFYTAAAAWLLWWVVSLIKYSALHHTQYIRTTAFTRVMHAAGTQHRRLSSSESGSSSSVVAQKKWKRAEEYGKNFQNRLKILNKLDETKYRLVKRKKKSEKWEGLNDLLVIFLCQFS